jgi:ribosome-binding factor A
MEGEFMSIKIERINNILKKEISYIIANEVRDKSINFVTITAVATTNDLSFAKVYFTTFDNKEEISLALKKAKGFIRSNLANRVEIRHIPELEFIYDDSIEYGKKIEDKISEIHKEG